MTETHEAKVRRFYNRDGEGAGLAYTNLMGRFWLHGAPDAEAEGKSPAEAAQVLLDRLTTIAGLKAGQWALDFGSGPGGATTYMAQITAAHFVGISNDESLNEGARALAAELDLPHQVHFLTVGDHDYRHLPWPDETFDVVTFFESVCHLPAKQAFFREALRVLKPGGHLVGTDWLQRPYGEHQTEEQIARIIDPMCEHIRLAGLGTLDSYAEMMREAGFQVTDAVDMFEGVQCWGSTPPEDREKWLSYDGPTGELFQDGKRALDAARGAGVFTVGWWAATRPESL